MRELAKPDDVKVDSQAIDKVRGNPSATSNAQALYTLAELPTKSTYGLPRTVNLQIGIRYMVTTNLDVADGLFNGACGIMKYIELSSNNSTQCVWLKFDDHSIGAAARSDRKNISECLKLKSDLTPIPKVKRCSPVTKKGKVHICREQFPLCVSEGTTIHKSQGHSKELVVVVMPKRMEVALMYVALSRATSLNGLYIIGEFKPPRPRPPNDPVIVEMNRMKNYCLMVPKYQWLRNIPDNCLQIVSHNVQSIRKHHRSIRSDNIYMNSHLLLFQEIWALAHEQYDFPDFDEVVRNDFNGRPSARGTMIYSKNNLIVYQGSTTSVQAANEHVEITSCAIERLKIINIYKHPKTTFEFFRNTLEQNSNLFDGNNILICGDFNQNIVKDSSIQRLMETEYRMKMISPKLPTTNDLTTIDIVFARLDSYTAHVTIYESLFSFHKPLVIRITEK